VKGADRSNVASAWFFKVREIVLYYRRRFYPGTDINEHVKGL